MTDRVLKFAPGQIIMLSAGCYSDYAVHAHLVTLRYCDFEALGKQFAAQPKFDGKYPSTHEFDEWLCANGYCATVDVTEVDMGSYHFELGLK